MADEKDQEHGDQSHEDQSHEDTDGLESDRDPAPTGASPEEYKDIPGNQTQSSKTRATHKDVRIENVDRTTA